MTTAHETGLNGPLHVATMGRADATASLALLHGFTQNGRCWGEFAECLAGEHQVVTVDAPGHGRSEHDHADLPTAAALIGETVGAAIYVGYSMGGRTGLHLALNEPELVQGLVLIGATAGLEDSAERHGRVAADDALASRLLADGLDAFLDSWLAQPLFESLPAGAANIEARLTNRPEGLAGSLRACGTGRQEPLWERLTELSMPVLVIAGESDAKFTALGRRLADGIGSNAELIVLPGGHALHLEHPEATAHAISGWLRSTNLSARPV